MGKFLIRRTATGWKFDLKAANGETVATAPMKITSYGNWDTAVTPDFTCEAADDVVVGVYVKCQGAGNGAWGKIDDALLNSVK